MGAQLTPDGVKFNGYDAVQTKPVKSVNGVEPNGSGEITVSTGNDHSSEISNLDNRVTTLENTGGGGNNALYAPPQTLFLDTSEIDQAQHQGNNWVYGPTSNETYPPNIAVYLKYIVPGFENFFDNHSDKYKLAIYSGCMYAEVIISDLVSFFDPTNNTSSTKKHYIHYDDSTGRDNELYFEFKNNDLIIHAHTPSTGDWATMWRIYRIDMHLNAFGGGVTTVNGQTGDVTVSTGGNWSTGWVNTDGTTTVENGVTLSFTHNLNSTDVIYQIHAADDANGTNSCVVDFQWDAGNTGSDQRGAQITDITDNNFKLRLGWGYGFPISPSQSTRWFNNRYVKVVARK